MKRSRYFDMMREIVNNSDILEEDDAKETIEELNSLEEELKTIEELENSHKEIIAVDLFQALLNHVENDLVMDCDLEFLGL